MSDKKRRPVMGKLITPVLRSGFQEGSTGPTTPLEFKVRSPRGMIKRDMSGVGLAIALALKKYNVMRSDPIPLSRSRNVGDLEMGVEASSVEEEKKIVTCHKLNKSFTKVYHGEHVTEINEQSCIFNISPARFGDDDMKVCQPSDFLSSCNLCNKRLHGKDIYMYRGEKAFCSPECRSRQITMDESAEKYCSSRASGTRCQTFATVIFAIEPYFDT